MNIQRQIIKRIKKGGPFSIYFPGDHEVYRRGMSDIDQIEYLMADLLDIAENGIPQFGLITIGLLKLTENLDALKDSYGAVLEADRIINGG